MTGLLVIGTIAVVAFLLVLLGAPGLFRPMVTYKIYFDNAVGIKQGAPVMLAGRKIGQVQKLFSPVSPEEEKQAEQAEAAIHAAVAEAKKRNWKMNVAVADSGGNLVAFERMDGAMLASIQIAIHKARAAATFRRPTKVFEEGINMMHLNYLLAFDGVIASRGGIPLIEQGKIIGAIGCSGGADSQDEVVAQAGAAAI